MNKSSAQTLEVWNTIPSPQTLAKVVQSLKAHHFKAELVPDRKSALDRVASLIPDGAQLMTGGSKSLDEIGFTELLKSGSHKWANLKEQVVAEKDRERQLELRRKAVFADYFLGSVHAVTESGELVAGSATGSQLAAYAYGGDNLILVVGVQKVTADLDHALRRLREYSTPLEDGRMKGLGFPGTYLSKIFIYEGEARRNVHVILVNEKLGF
jgi:YkgG family uncharacterized protein